MLGTLERQPAEHALDGVEEDVAALQARLAGSADALEMMGIAKQIEALRAFEAARAYFKAHLQGTVVKTAIGDVHLLGSGFSEMKRGMKTDRLKSLLVPMVPNILRGHYDGRQLPSKPRTDFVAFHFFLAELRIEDMTVTAGVNVGERAEGKLQYMAYGLNHSHNPAWKKKEASGGAGDEPASDASDAASKLDDASSMPNLAEPVNRAGGDGWNIVILQVLDSRGNRLSELEDTPEFQSSGENVNAAQDTTTATEAVHVTDAAALDAAAATEAEAKREVNERAEKLGLRAKQGGSSVSLSSMKSAWMHAFKTWTEALEWLTKREKGGGMAFTLDSAETEGLHQQLAQATSVMAKLALAKAIMAARATAATIAGMFKFATATEEARNLLAIGASNPAEVSTYKAAVEVEKACASMGLAVAWEATATLPVFEPAEEALDSASGADEEDEGEDFDAEAEFDAMPEEEEGEKVPEGRAE